MPKHPQLAVVMGFDGDHRFIHAKKLVIFSDHFIAVVMIENEVFNLVQQAVFLKQTAHRIIQADLLGGNLLAVNTLFFIVHP